MPETWESAALNSIMSILRTNFHGLKLADLQTIKGTCFNKC